MGPWDDEVKNGFDDMFDLDRDGKLDFDERSMQLDFMSHEFDDDYSDNNDFDDD
ncbi:MAG: hypothetical protein K6G88_10320 [Lachnospiraceae bacterium]|nr:hypothetical protein [Lachnospiraceae bacterium]